MTDLRVIQRPLREEKFVDSRPAGPFAELKGVHAPSAYQRHLLRTLADSAIECAALLDAMSTIHEILHIGRHRFMDAANRAAVAKPHIDALIAELSSIEEAYGIELTNQVKRDE
jgi:hypothetical protein